ncbi:MAG: hypothetical protein E7208_09525 [Clostridium butyricum]|nr:hypothetical protein [Clostridium butyricum]
MRNMRYLKILHMLCKYYDIEEKEFLDLLKSKENKYLLLLLLKNNDCFEVNAVKELFNLKTSRTINNNLRQAEEKLLINRSFREKYFDLENQMSNDEMINL